MLYGMVRCKNEERWIERSLWSLVNVCPDGVFVLDDWSTDGTKAIIQQIEGCYYIPSPFTDLQESRDKTFLLSQITRRIPMEEIGNNSPHWVICIDGDEELYAPDLVKLKHAGRTGCSYSFQILTLRDDPSHIRVDGPYSNLFRPSMFRLIRPNMRFISHAGHGGGFHCSNVPADIGFGVTVHEPEPVRVLHYGYMEKADRERKYKFYTEHDPGHRDWYEKECHGEPVVVPLESVL